MLSALRDQGGHISATRVAEIVRAELPHVDTSTIYRILADLRDARLVAEARFGSGETTYELIARSAHHHLFCRGCGATGPLEDSLVDAFVASVRDLYRFEANADHLVLQGTCRECLDGG